MTCYWSWFELMWLETESWPQKKRVKANPCSVTDNWHDLLLSPSPTRYNPVDGGDEVYEFVEIKLESRNFTVVGSLDFIPFWIMTRRLHWNNSIPPELLVNNYWNSWLHGGSLYRRVSQWVAGGRCNTANISAFITLPHHHELFTSFSRLLSIVQMQFHFALLAHAHTGYKCSTAVTCIMVRVNRSSTIIERMGICNFYNFFFAKQKERQEEEIEICVRSKEALAFLIYRV